MAEPKAVISTMIAEVRIAPAKIADHSTYEAPVGLSEMRGASVDVSVIGVSPLLCCSAQTEEGKDEHDDHDKTNDVDDAVHDFLHKCDGLQDRRRAVPRMFFACALRLQRRRIRKATRLGRFSVRMDFQLRPCR